MRRPGLLVGEVTVGMFGEPGLPQADGRRSPVRIDYRKRVGKRARELGQHFTAAVDAVGREVTVELAAAIGGAAELVALVEDMRARALRGVDVNSDDLLPFPYQYDLRQRFPNVPSSGPS